MSKLPTISVIVPVYNGGEYLRTCLESLHNQTFEDIEVIIINDGSTDNSAETIAGFCARDSRFIAITQDNAGVSAARNRGLDEARGEWISFIDCDDWIEPNTYTELIELATLNRAEAVMFAYSVDCEGKKPEEHRTGERDCGLLDNHAAMGLVYRAAPFSVTKLYRRELIGGTRYKTDIYRGEDTVFVIEALKNAERIYSTPKPFYHYVQSAGSAARGSINARQLTGATALKWMLDFADENYPELHGKGVCGYVNIMIELSYDIFRFKYNDKAIVRQWQAECKRYKKEIYRLCGRRSVLGIKTMAFCFSPKLFFFLIGISRKRKYGDRQ